MPQCYRWHRGRGNIWGCQITKNLCKIRHCCLLNIPKTQLCYKRYKYVFTLGVLITIQFLFLVKIRANYIELYSIVNSSIPDTFWHEYYEMRKVSVRHVSSFSLKNDFVIVTACGRDIAPALPIFRSNLYSILRLFKDYRIFLGESDSVDTTLINFQQWRNEDSKVYVYTYGNLTATYSRNRAHRIAFCRNNLLQVIRGNNWIRKAKFLLVMDIDINANAILTVDNFLTNFKYDIRDWAAMTASQTKLYYDVWAVRTHALNYDCWNIVDPLKHQEIARKIYVYVHAKPIPRELGLIPVRSAFGGFGVYQTVYLNNCYYKAFDETIRQTCEHISFHDCIVNNGGKIFINSEFQNADGLTN